MEINRGLKGVPGAFRRNHEVSWGSKISQGNLRRYQGIPEVPGGIKVFQRVPGGRRKVPGDHRGVS